MICLRVGCPRPPAPLSTTLQPFFLRLSPADYEGGFVRRDAFALLVTAVSLCHSTRFTVEAPLDSLSLLANSN